MLGEPLIDSSAPPVPITGGWTLSSVYALGVLAHIYALSFFDNSAFSILLPLIKADLRLSDSELGWLAGAAFVLFYALFSLPVARISDRFNRRNLIACGVALWSAMTLLTGMATNIWQLAVTRFIMGAGETTGVAPLMSMVSDMFERPRRPLAIAVVTSGAGITGLVFIPLAGMMAQSLGWRSVYWVAGATGLALSAILFLTVGEPIRGRWDGRTASIRAISLGVALRYLIARKAYLCMLVYGASVMLTGTAVMTWATTFLVRVHHLDVAAATALIGPVGGVLSILGSLSGGVISTRLNSIDPHWRIWLPTLMCAALCPTLYVFLSAPSLMLAMTGKGLYSFAFAMLLPTTLSLVLELTPAVIRSVGVSVYILVMTLVGQVAGPAMVGILNDRLVTFYGDGAIRYSMLSTAVFALVASIALAIASVWLNSDSTRARYPIEA